MNNQKLSHASYTRRAQGTFRSEIDWNWQCWILTHKKGLSIVSLSSQPSSLFACFLESLYVLGECLSLSHTLSPSHSLNGCLNYYFFIGINSPQALKKILSLSEEGSLERHRKQAEDTISNASSQLSSPPTSPQSSPRKGMAQWLLSLRRSTHSVQRIPEWFDLEVSVLCKRIRWMWQWIFLIRL